MNSRAIALSRKASSPIHKLSAGLKLGIVLLLITVINLITMPPIIGLPLFLLVFTVAVLSRTSVLYILKRLVVLAPLCLLVILTQYITRHLSPVQTSQLILKALTSMALVILLTATTSNQSLFAVMAVWGVPRIMTTLFNFMYRFAFILKEELEKMMTNVRLRRQQGGIISSIRLYSMLLGVLFIRSYDRSERVFRAMVLRGFGEDSSR
jgi:cobalt/nickel transport system permease protein